MYRIWIVEDELEISLSLKKFLESWGYQVSIAEDFQNVLETFHRLQPDLVLMDITLPYANGYLWTEKIREISKVPIIFISSARAENAPGWQKGSPPLNVTPSRRGSLSTASTIFEISQSYPPLKSWVS